jgi:hypothetical protein
VAVVAAVIGHVGLGPPFDPLALTVSDFALSDHGAAITVAMVALGVASLALVAGLLAVRAPVRGWPAALLLAWSVGLLVAAAVPTDPVGVPGLTPAGHVHRYASVTAFVCLPAGALLLTRRLTADPRARRMVAVVRPLVLASGVGLLTMAYVAFPGGRLLIGLAERALIAVEVALVAVLAAWLRCLATAGRVRGEQLQFLSVPPVGAAQRSHAQPPHNGERALVVRSHHRVDDRQPMGEAVGERRPRRLRGVPVPPRVRVQVPADLDLTPVARQRLEEESSRDHAGLADLDCPAPQAAVPLMHGAPALEQQRRVRGHAPATQPPHHLVARVDVADAVEVRRIVRPHPNDEPLGLDNAHPRPLVSRCLGVPR